MPLLAGRSIDVAGIGRSRAVMVADFGWILSAAGR